MLLSYKYRLAPNQAQSIALADMLGDFCQLYNAALEHRIRAYAKGVSIGRNEQITALPQIRRELPHQGRWSSSAQQQVMRKLDRAYKAFFNRIKRGDKAGFPRFKARDCYHAADFRVGDGLTLRKSGKLGFVGVPGEVKVRWHRALPSKPKAAVLLRAVGKWYVVFYVEVAATMRDGPVGTVGLDMGLASLVALSNGELVRRPNVTKRNARLLRVRQRAAARCRRGSQTQRSRKAAVAKLQSQMANARRDFLHKESRKIVGRFDRIAVEALNISGLASSMLAKDVNDAAWSTLIEMLAYKAANAGGELIKVDPRGTSRTCPECGAIAAKVLKERIHRCDCGCILDRDVASAIVIHNRAFGLLPGAGSGSLIQRNAA